MRVVRALEPVPKLATLRTVGLNMSWWQLVFFWSLCRHQQYEHIIKAVRSVKLRHVELLKIAHFLHACTLSFPPSLSDRTKRKKASE